MITGACHCGTVSWRFTSEPDSATACNCTVCRRYGALWIYDYEDEGVEVSGSTGVYVRDEDIGFHFCERCGCICYWRGLRAGGDGRRRLAVNVRLAEPEAVAHLPIRHFEGFESFQDLPMDGRCVSDYWF